MGEKNSINNLLLKKNFVGAGIDFSGTQYKVTLFACKKKEKKKRHLATVSVCLPNVHHFQQ